MTKPKTVHSKTELQTTDLSEPLAALSESAGAKPTTLYEAETALVLLEDLLARAAQDASEVTEEQLGDAANQYLEATNATKEAVERYCWLIFHRLKRSEERKAQAKVWETTVRELKAIAQQDENLAQRLKQRLLAFFDRREVTKLETTTFRLSARNNGGKQALVLDESCSIQDVAQLYPNLIRLEIDREAVREFLENGGELPFAYLEERGRSLVIKP